jgi:Protein of unknown function (DUF3307)
MPKITILPLAAVAVLMFKHAVADFYLQTSYQYLNKGTYGHPGGFLHAGIHAALTPFVYLVLVPSSLLLVLGITLAEFAVHYHVDWLKEQVTHRNGWTSRDRILVRTRHRPACARADLPGHRRGACGGGLKPHG